MSVSVRLLTKQHHPFGTNYSDYQLITPPGLGGFIKGDSVMKVLFIFSKLKVFCASAIMLVSMLVVSSSAFADANFPTRPITMTVGFSAGGPTDNAARVVAEELSKELGQPVVVSNKPGAGGVIAARDLLNSSPDGYTIMLVSNGPMTVVPARYASLDFDPLTDFVPIGMVAGYPHILVVGPESDISSFQDFIEKAKASPGTLNVAQVGSVNELATEWIKALADIEVTQVPYKGAAAVVSDLSTGRIDLAMIAPNVAYPLIEGNKARAIAATSSTEITKARNIPSIAQSGIPDIDFYIWNGLVAPKGTDPAVVKKMSDALAKVQQNPALKEKLAVTYLDIVPGGPDRMMETVKKEGENWKRIATDANLPPL